MDNFDLRKFVSEKTLLNENAPGYDTRKQGEALPTMESVKAAYEAKNNIKEYLEPNELEDMGYNHGEKYLMNDIDSSLFNQPYFEHYLSGFMKGLKDNVEASKDYADSIDTVDEAKNDIKEDEDYDTDGYVEAMNPELFDHIDEIIRIFKEWKDGSMTEPGMEGYAKDNLVDYIQMKIRNA
tara:strand:- start:48 stop:590 length:543 start_codon:yes stop_codon:yes gene_type:complete